MSAASATAAIFTAIFAAAPASAQVAIAVTIAEEDTSQRDIAAAVVAVARQKWQLKSPQLSAAQLQHCAAGDTPCLRRAAEKAGARHLLVIGVAPLGVRDRVVAVQLFDVGDASPIFEESAVQPGLNDDQLIEVKKLADRLVTVSGPAPFVPIPSYVPGDPNNPPEEPGPSLGPWTWTGFALLGVGGATAIASGSVGFFLVEARTSNAEGQNVYLYGIIGGGVLAALGTAALVVDTL